MGWLILDCRGAGRKPILLEETADRMEESHVRFQDSDFDELENFDENERVEQQLREENNNSLQEEEGEEEGECEVDYATVTEPGGHKGSDLKHRCRPHSY